MANRRLPSLSLARASLALREAAGWSAAGTKAAPLKQAMVAKRVSLDVVFIVRSYLFEVENAVKTVEAEPCLTRTRSATAIGSERGAELKSVTIAKVDRTAVAVSCIAWLALLISVIVQVRKGWDVRQDGDQEANDTSYRCPE